MINEIITILRATVLGFINDVANFFPKLITGLIFILIGWIISRVIRGVVVSVSERVGIDGIFENAGLTNGLKKMNVGMSPSQLIGAVLYWVIFLNFLLAGLDAMGLAGATQPLEQLITSIPAIIAGLIFFVLGTMFAQFIGKAVSGGAAGAGIEFHESLGNIVQMLVMGGVAIIAIQQMGLPADVLQELFITLIAIATVGLAIAFGLGGRSVARNVLAGFYARELFRAGDILSIDGYEGELEGIGTLNSEVRVGDSVMTVPNTRLTEGTVLKKG